MSSCLSAAWTCQYNNTARLETRNAEISQPCPSSVNQLMDIFQHYSVQLSEREKKTKGKGMKNKGKFNTSSSKLYSHILELIKDIKYK